MVVKKMIFCLTIFALCQIKAEAQEWISYKSEQKINDLVDTGEELLMATDAGLVVLNKTTLEKTIFNKFNSSLTNNHIQSITRTSSGNTWIGTYDMRLAQFDGTDFQNTITPEGDFNPNTTLLYDLEIAPNGDVWVGSSEGIFRKEGSYWSKYDQAEIGTSFYKAWDIEIDNDGDVFIASNFIHKFSNNEWSNISETSQLFGYLDADIHFTESGNLYFAGDLDRIGRYDGTEWEEFEIDGFDTDLNGSEVLRFTEDAAGNTYFNTRQNGIFKLENGIWTPYVDAQTEAYDNKTSYFYIDEEGNRWLNDNIHLSVNNNGNIQTITISDYTIESNNIYGLSKGNNGSMYFMSVSENNIAALAADGTWSFFPYPPMSMDFETFYDMLFLSDDDIWLASANGYYHYDGIEWTFTALDNCHSFARDSQGKIYLHYTLGIRIIDNETITDYTTSNSLITSSFISGYGIDANDNLWITGTDANAIYKVSPNGNWTTYTNTNHPAINEPYGNFHFDIDGNVWVPSNALGAIKFDGATFTNPYVGNISEIPYLDVDAIESDDSGKMYFSHPSGVITLYDGEWEDLRIEEVPLDFSSHSTEILFDDAGTLWWVSQRYGVYSYTPETSTAITQNIEEAISFSVYPNPAKDYIILDFTMEKQEDVKILIHNYLGQLITHLDLGETAEGTFNERIDLARLPKGFYLIQLQVGDEISTKKIVIE